MGRACTDQRFGVAIVGKLLAASPAAAGLRVRGHGVTIPTAPTRILKVPVLTLVTKHPVVCRVAAHIRQVEVELTGAGVSPGVLLTAIDIPVNRPQAVLG